MKKVVDMYLRTTTFPLFPMFCGTFLDIRSALIFIQVWKDCAVHKYHLFYYADVRDAWQAYLQTDENIIQRIAVAFLVRGPFCNPRVRPPSMQAGQDEITNNRLMTFRPRLVQYL